jgi:hypothetical protein
MQRVMPCRVTSIAVMTTHVHVADNAVDIMDVDENLIVTAALLVTVIEELLPDGAIPNRPPWIPPSRIATRPNPRLKRACLLRMLPMHPKRILFP